MRKLLTAGIFGTILGIVGTGTANASIVSSGFLDEKLTEYALSTSLDLKANQSDLTALSNKIGTLPDGITVANLYDGWKIPSGRRIHGLSMIAQDSFTTYDHLNDTLIDGPKPESGGYLEVLSRLLRDNGYEEPNNGTLAPFWYLTKQALRVGEIPHGKTAADMIDEINTKISDLPSGNLPTFSGYEFLFPDLNQPLTYPTSLAELISAIYGNSNTREVGLLAGFITGFGFDFNADGRPETPIGLIPNHNLAEHAEKLAIENAAKIGTLPAGYDSVGAALTAIKGIAEDAKAAALAAIPDPKQEGSSGKFVLTVDIVGDNATYHWEKIDREGETTTTE